MKFAAYAEHRDSGVEWLGQIPDHWRSMPLKRVASIRYGLGQPPSEALDGIPLLRATDFHRGVISPGAMMRIDPREVPPGRDAILSTGEIIIVRSGAYTGDSALVTSDYAGAVAGYDMVVRITNGHPPFFAWQFLSQEFFDLQVGFFRNRAAQPHLNAEELGSVFVTSPPLPEQQAIAAFLDRETGRIDEMIAAKQRLIGLLEEKRTALISHAVTRGLNPHAPLKDTGIEWLGQIPEHWEVASLRRFVFSMCDGPFGSDMKSSHYSEEGVRLIRLQNIGNGLFEDTDKAFVPEEHFLSLPGHDARPGDLLIAGLGDENHPVGRACIVPAHVTEAMVKADCFRLRLNEVRLLHSFAALYLCSQAARGEVTYRTRGATRSRMNLNGASELLVPVPPVEEQQDITAQLERECARFVALTVKVREAIEHLQEYRTALISAAVTGKIDVRGS